MSAFTNILVAFDGSEHSRRALDTALKIAQCSHCPIKIVYAFDKVPAILGDEETEHFIERVMNRGREILAEAAQRVQGTGVECSMDNAEGPAAEAILRVAQLEASDLIVIGSRGLSMLQGILLGSVSYRVLHHATVPVLVVH
jgi:nucleotide-binding universal stress UspA family protein